MITQLINP